MNLTQTISTDYRPYKDLELLLLTRSLATKNTGGPYSGVTNPTVAEYSVLIDAFETAVNAFATGLHAARLERDRTRTLLEAATRHWSAYAEGETEARPDLWAAAGFPLTKDTTKPRTPSAPVENFKLGDGPASLSLAASVDKQPGMYCYLWRIRPKAGPAGRYCYETLISREPLIILTGLDVETAYCVECAAWNDTGEPQWSPALSRIAQ